jgi:hypothetical protein
VSEIRHLRNYYLLIILMAGVIDDFQDALNELMRAVNLPVSVVIVKVGGNQDENDSKNLMELSQQAFQKAEREFVKVIDYEYQYKKKITT